MGWQDRDWAKWTDDERNRYVGRTPSAAPRGARGRGRGWLSGREVVLLLALVGLIALVARSEGGFGRVLDRLGSVSLGFDRGPAVGGAWPDGVVRYYNAAPEHEWALQQAVDAWNRSGAQVRLLRTSRVGADLVVESDARRKCGHGRATLGYSVPATVSIFGLRVGRGCDRYSAARALTHELGHVLGLDHTTAACAAMNPAGSYAGSPHCPPSPPSYWRCRLLEPSDLAAIVEIYGGMPAPLRAEPLCAV